MDLKIKTKLGTLTTRYHPHRTRTPGFRVDLANPDHTYKSLCDIVYDPETNKLQIHILEGVRGEMIKETVILQTE